MSYNKIFSLPFIICLSLGVGCSPVEDNKDVVPTNHGNILTPEYLPITEDNACFKSFDATSGKVTVEIYDHALVPEVGKVFVWTSEDDSSIRRVKSVSSHKGIEYELETEEAAMTDIFSSANFTLASNKAVTISKSSGGTVFFPVKVSIDGIQTKASDALKVLSTSTYLSEVLWSDPSASSVFNVEGSFESSLDLILDFNFNSAFDALGKTLKSELELGASISGTVSVDCGVKMDYRKGYEIEQKGIIIKENVIPTVKMTFLPYGVPIIVQCSTDLMGDNSLSVSGEFEASLGASCSLNTTAGLKYSQKTGQIKFTHETSKSIKPMKPRLSGAVSIEDKASLYPRFKVYLYGVVGPILDIKPYFKQTVSGEAKAELGENANFDASLVYSAYLGMDLGASIHLPTLNGQGRDVGNKEFKLFENEIYRAPKEIAVKSRPTPSKPAVTFAVYDYNPYTDETVPAALPIPVAIKSNKSESIMVATNGELTVPINKTDAITKIEASVKTPSGDISKAEYEKDIRDVLIAIYESTDGDHWYNNTNWLSDKPIEEWFGIVPNNREQIQYSIILPNNNLNGTIDISECQNLWALQLNGNKITSVKLSDVAIIDEFNLENNPLETLIWKNVVHNTRDFPFSINNTPIRYLDFWDDMLGSKEWNFSILGWKGDHLELNGTIESLFIDGDGSQSSIKIHGEHLKMITSNDKWNNVKNIDFSDCPVLESFNYCKAPSLESLNLADCSSLETVSVGGCTQLSQIYFTNCNKLKTVDLGYCNNLKEVSFIDSPNLISLNTNECTELSNINLINCYKLESADFRKTGIKELSLTDRACLNSVFLNGCSRLNSVDLSGCSSLENLDH